MASKNELKKMMIFSSHENRRVIEGIVRDHANLSGQTESSVIEHALIQSLLPADKNAQYWVTLLYNGESLAKAYANVFECFSAGLDWQARWQNGKPLVEEFSRALAMTFPMLIGQEKEIHHFETQLRTIYSFLNKEDQFFYDKIYIDDCLEKLKEDAQQVSVFEVVNILLRNWQVLSNNTIAYRALKDLAMMSASNFRDDFYTRSQFVKVLKQVTDEW